VEVFNVDSVLKKINNKEILNDVAFSVKKGEVLALFGRNGSGKSTLFKCILGLETADFIYRKFNDKILKQADLIKLFSYSSQEVFLPDNLTVKRLISFFDLNRNETILNEEIIQANLNVKVKDIYISTFIINLLILMAWKFLM